MAGSLIGDEELIAGINITPLVDVVLVLLVIFLMTAPVIYQSAIKVQLPQAKTGIAAEKSPLSFTITKEGELLWDNHPINWETLEQRLKAMGPHAASEAAIISADKQTPHGTVIRLMDALREVGLTRFALNVETVSSAGK